MTRLLGLAVFTGWMLLMWLLAWLTGRILDRRLRYWQHRLREARAEGTLLEAEKIIEEEARRL